jgi:hypothetical protein
MRKMTRRSGTFLLFLPYFHSSIQGTRRDDLSVSRMCPTHLLSTKPQDKEDHLKNSRIVGFPARAGLPRFCCTVAIQDIDFLV